MVVTHRLQVGGRRKSKCRLLGRSYCLRTFQEKRVEADKQALHTTQHRGAPPAPRFAGLFGARSSASGQFFRGVRRTSTCVCPRIRMSCVRTVPQNPMDSKHPERKKGMVCVIWSHLETRAFWAALIGSIRIFSLFKIKKAL